MESTQIIHNLTEAQTKLKETEEEFQKNIARTLEAFGPDAPEHVTALQNMDKLVSLRDDYQRELAHELDESKDDQPFISNGRIVGLFKTGKSFETVFILSFGTFIKMYFDRFALRTELNLKINLSSICFFVLSNESELHKTASELDIVRISFKLFLTGEIHCRAEGL